MTDEPPSRHGHEERTPDPLDAAPQEPDPVSAENIAFLCETYGAWQRGDIAALAKAFAPTVHWQGIKPEEGDCNGSAEVLAVVRGRIEEGVRVELRELIPVGRHVVAAAHSTADRTCRPVAARSSSPVAGRLPWRRRQLSCRCPEDALGSLRVIRDKLPTLAVREIQPAGDRVLVGLWADTMEGRPARWWTLLTFRDGPRR